MRIFTIFLILLSQVASAQDSTAKIKIRIFDLNIFMAFDFIENERKINLNYIHSFSKDSRHHFNNSAYPDTINYALYDDPGGETDGGEFGFSMSFKFQNGRTNITRRLKPRIGVFYNYKQFFSYDLNLRNTTRLVPITPGGNTTAYDSIALRKLSYSYYSEQIFLEAGTNYDIYTRKNLIVYSGLLYSQGISYKNEFTTERLDSYRIDQVTAGSEQTGNTIILHKTSYSSGEPISHSLRASIPLGLQQRFSTKENFSVGLMLEGRLGYERYIIERGRSVTYALFAISAGLRFSFEQHK